MKGIIFVELVDFMEQALGIVGQEAVIEAAALPNDGAFTSVGSYPTGYAITLVTKAAEHAGACPNELCRLFGRFLFNRFEIKFPEIMSRYPTAYDLLSHVETHIHEEVRKLYPGATPPHVTLVEDDGVCRVEYESHRPFAHVAFGLVEQCVASYREPTLVEWCPDSAPNRAAFILRPVANAEGP